jgi:hypothetical protein
MAQPATIANIHKDWFDDLPERLSEAVDEYNLPETDDWSALAELSSQTLFEGIEVYGGDAVFEKSRFVAPATVYVKLVYDPNSSDPAEIDESYPARVFFSIKGKKTDKQVEVHRIEVDTSSFFK